MIKVFAIYSESCNGPPSSETDCMNDSIKGCRSGSCPVTGFNFRTSREQLNVRAESEIFRSAATGIFQVGR